MSRLLGHAVDSVASRRLKGWDNGRLYREVAFAYDLLFTKDRESAGHISTLPKPAPGRVILTIIAAERAYPERLGIYSLGGGAPAAVMAVGDPCSTGGEGLGLAANGCSTSIA